MHYTSILLIWSLLFLPFGTAIAQESKGTREFFSTNKDGRVRVKVQLWGSVGVAGTHYVPDSYSLIDLIGIGGGPVGHLSQSRILLRRYLDQKGTPLPKPQVVEFEGTDLIKEDKAAGFKLHNNDVVYVESDPTSSETFMRNLSIVSSITGLLSTLLLTYFIVEDRKDK